MIVCAASSQAVNIDVTHSAFATVATECDLSLHFGVWNYGAHNPGFDPFPTSIGFRIIGPLMTGANVVTNQNSTVSSLTDFAFEAYLESLDGAVAIPSFGSVIPTLGSVWIEGGSPIQMAVLSGSFTFSLDQSRAVFGANLANFDNAAVIRLHNVGDPFRIGLGDTYSVQNATSEPGIGGLGPSRTAGIPGTVILSTPEPAAWMLMGSAIAFLGLIGLTRRKCATSCHVVPCAASASLKESGVVHFG